MPDSTALAHQPRALTRDSMLRETTHALSQAFLHADQNSPEAILDKCFVADHPQITEHGPLWARDRLPFLAQTFTGRAACLEYFASLNQVLAVELDADSFPPPAVIVVDANVAPDHRVEPGASPPTKSGVTSLVARGKFRARKTGTTWEEQFIWRCSLFDDDGRIGHWEIWADPLSAWAAVGEA